MKHKSRIYKYGGSLFALLPKTVAARMALVAKSTVYVEDKDAEGRGEITVSKN